MRQTAVSQQVSKTDHDLNQMANSMDFKEHSTLGSVLKSMGIEDTGNYFYLGKRKNSRGEFTTIGMMPESSLKGIEQVTITSHKIGG